MKKTVSCILAVLFTLSTLGCFSFAATWHIDENPTIELKNVAPVIDGVINADEGWSQKAMLDENTVGYFGLPFQLLTSSAELYFACSADGLYFAADYTDQKAAYCVKFYDEEGRGTHIAVYADPNAGTYKAEPGGFPEYTPDGVQLLYYRVDDYTWSAPEGVIPEAVFWRVSTEVLGAYNSVEPSFDVDYLDLGAAGWNGDTLCLSLDPFSLFNTGGHAREIAPLYCFSVFTDGSVRIARSRSQTDRELTDSCSAAGSIDDSGFVFEAFIPWSVIADDLNAEAEACGLDHTFTVDELSAPGADYRAAVTLYDRFFDSDIGDVDTCGRYVTVCAVTDAGQPGYLSDGDTFDAMGLRMVIAQPEETGSPVVTETPVSDEAESGKSEETSGSPVTTQKSGSVTTKSQSTGRSSGGTSAATFDAGIALSVGLLIISAIVIYCVTKKARKN